MKNRKDALSMLNMENSVWVAVALWPGVKERTKKAGQGQLGDKMALYLMNPRRRGGKQVWNSPGGRAFSLSDHCLCTRQPFGERSGGAAAVRAFINGKPQQVSGGPGSGLCGCNSPWPCTWCGRHQVQVQSCGHCVVCPIIPLSACVAEALAPVVVFQS